MYDKESYDLGPLVKYYALYGMWIQKLQKKDERKIIFGLFIEDRFKCKATFATRFLAMETIKCLNLALSPDSGIDEKVFDIESKPCLYNL